MADLVEVKVSKAVPTGATAVGTPVFSDRIKKVDGVRPAAMSRAGFTGAAGSQLILNDGNGVRVLIGMGPFSEVGTVELRRAGATFSRSVKRHIRIGFDLAVVLDLGIEGLDDSEAVRAVTEGLILGAYYFDVYKPSSSESRNLSAAVIGVGARVRDVAEGLSAGQETAAAVCFARDLVNEPGGSLTPTVFAERSAERATGAGLTAEILDEKAIAKAGLAGLLAVNLGSEEPPRMLKLTYEPSEEVAAKSEDGSVETVALVGKGITFDSGGLSLKPADSMIGMKNDMAGAAAVISAMCALPSLNVGVRVVSFTPMTDNMTGGRAQRPGDIYKTRNGKTIEVLNTDAEGRLVLADALILASEEKPAAIVDLATLTGACLVALGQKIAGLMGNDEDFISQVSAAAGTAGERVWHLPLPADYRKGLESEIADLKNIATGRYGGTLTAGLFLKEFVEDGIPWVHLDIAGPAFVSDTDGENSSGATGFGVRTLLHLLESWSTETEDSEAEGDESELG
ncbi:MAG TPA: leucyl aminopeptidase [Microthrixaceae bacterium]|nr:leucyl aminopeptidase [Microthrixaceae bacterium]